MWNSIAPISSLPKTFRVLLIGDTPEWIVPSPAEVAREAGWADHTILRLKFVPEREMPLVFGAVDVVVMLYREPKASSGILSLCRQYGVPVLATEFGEIGTEVRRCNLGVTVDPVDDDEIRAAIVQLLSGERAAASPAHANRPALSWAESARAHAGLYAAVLGRASHMQGEDCVIAAG